jgi:hypothetical protein
MQAANGMMAVWLNVPPEREEEFNAWYETEHLADVIAIDGFISARRYYDAGSRLRFLALYEAVDETVEPGPGFQAMVAKPTPWSARIRTFYGDMRIRSNFRLQADSGFRTEPGAIITVHGKRAPADSAQEKLASRPNCTRYRGYTEADDASAGFEIYDFGTLEQARAALPLWGSDKDVRLTPMSAIGAPHVHARQ